MLVWNGPDLRLGDLRDRDALGVVAEEEHVDRVLRVLGLDELDHRQRDLLGRGEAILAVQDHRVRDVDGQDRRARGQVLFLVHLEVVGLQRDLLGVALDRVADRADAVDRGGVVAELVGSGLGQQLASRAGPRHGVVARARFGQRREDLLERGAADAPLARGRQRELPAAVLDHLALLQLLAELLQVDAGVDHAAVLEVLHPAQRFLDVAARLEDQLQEELEQLLHGQDLAEQVVGVVGVAVAHRPAILRPRRNFPRACACERC